VRTVDIRLCGPERGKIVAVDDSAAYWAEADAFATAACAGTRRGLGVAASLSLPSNAARREDQPHYPFRSACGYAAPSFARPEPPYRCNRNGRRQAKQSGIHHIKFHHYVGALLFPFAWREGNIFTFGTVDLRDDLTYIWDGTPRDELGSTLEFPLEIEGHYRKAYTVSPRRKVAEFYLTCTMLDAAGCVGVSGPFRIETTSGGDQGGDDGGTPDQASEEVTRRRGRHARRSPSPPMCLIMPAPRIDFCPYN